MPMIRLEIVAAADEPRPTGEGLQVLADEIGTCLEAPPGETWLSVSYLSRSQYFESGGSISSGIQPVFARVLMYQLPDRNALVPLVERLTGIVSRHLGRPPENTHLVFEPDGRGRVAFGGQLVQ